MKLALEFHNYYLNCRFIQQYFFPVFIILIFSCSKVEPNHCDNESYVLRDSVMLSTFNEKYAAASSSFKLLLKKEKSLDITVLKAGLLSLSNTGDFGFIDSLLPTLSQEKIDLFEKSEWSDEYLSKKFVFKNQAKNVELQKKLLVLYLNDQLVRGNNISPKLLRYFNDSTELTSFHVDALETDEINSKRLYAILDESTNFPTENEVGAVGIDALFALIQHNKSIEFQKKHINNFKILCQNDSRWCEKYAYLHDRIKIRTGEKQLYGTQFMNVQPEEGIAEFYPIDDSINVNCRRQMFHMLSLQTYRKIMLISIK